MKAAGRRKCLAADGLAGPRRRGLREGREMVSIGEGEGQGGGWRKRRRDVPLRSNNSLTPGNSFARPKYLRAKALVSATRS
jgi:hypothetical protein